MKNKGFRKNAAAGTAFLLAAAMPAATVYAGEAPVKPEKEQTVYVNADETGKTEKIIVSNWLKNTEKAETLQDQSTLSDIENVKGEENYTTDAQGNMLWDANGADIYYQGESTQSLPVEVKLSYFLNGKEISARELAGKSGKVKIRIDYKNHSTQKVDGKEVVTPFLMMTGMILPGENFSNVEVTNGRVISDGQKSIVVGMGLPGLAEQLRLNEVEALDEIELPDYVEVTADAEDFTLGMTATVVTTGALSELGLDEVGNLDDLKDKLDQLTDASSQLVDGSSRLWEGTADLSDGAKALDDGVKEWKDGMSRLNEGLMAADQGAGALSDGLNTMDAKKGELVSGVDQLAEGLASLEAGAGNLESGVGAYTAGVSQLAAGSAMVDEGASRMKDGLDLLSGNGPEESASIKDLQAGSAILEKGIGDYTKGVETLRDGIAVLKKEMDQKLGSAEQLPEGAKTLVSGCEQVEKALEGMAGGIEQVEQAAMEIKGKLEAFNQGISGAEKLTRGAAAVIEQAKTQANEQANEQMKAKVAAALEAAGIPEEQRSQVMEKLGRIDVSGNLQTDSETLQSYAEQLKGIAEQLKAVDVSGIEQLAAGAKAANEKLGQLKNGAEKIGAAGKALEHFPEMAKQILDAVDTMNTGAEKLCENNEMLNIGAQKLTGGIDAMKMGIDQLTAGASDLKKGTATLNMGANQVIQNNLSLNQGAAAICAGSKKLAAGSKTLQIGAGSLSEGVGQLTSGAKALKKGTSQLAAGGKQLENGGTKIKSGTEQLVDGTAQLRDGAEKLKDGISEMDNEGIRKIADIFSGDLEALLERLDDEVTADGQYRSFDGTGISDKDSVKFIIETAGIE